MQIEIISVADKGGAKASQAPHPWVRHCFRPSFQENLFVLKQSSISRKKIQKGFCTDQFGRRVELDNSVMKSPNLFSCQPL